MPPFLRTLRGQVLIGVFGAWLVVVGVIASVLLPRVRNRLVGAEETRAVQLAGAVAGAVGTNLDVALDELEASANLEVVRTLNPEILDVALASLQVTSPLFLHFTVLSPEGVVLSRPVLPEHVGESRADRPYMQAVADGAERFIGEPRMSSLGSVSLNVATPIRDAEGTVQGVLMGAFGAADRNPFLYQPILMPAAPDPWRFLLLSREGFLLADSRGAIRPEEGLAGLDLQAHPAYTAPDAGVVRYQEAGEGRVAAVALVGDVGWRVVAEVPEPVFQAPTAEALGDLILAGTVSALLMLLVGLALAQRVVRRLTPLTAALQRHATVSEPQLLEEQGEDEIGQAIRAFNRMVLDRQRLREELREKEQSLLQAGKMEALGRLAGGVAHDFNNLLTVVIGYAGLVRPADDAGRKGLTMIGNAADQARTLSHSLLNFSRKRAPVMEPVDLNEVILSAQVLLEPLIGRHVELVLRPHAAPVVVSGDRHQLQQIVVNMAINARDAMKEGGRLEIGATTRAPLSPGWKGARHDRMAVLYVEDDGDGMVDEQVAFIFEPFFTTKPPGEGTGLGLSMARTVMEGLGGWIEVDTALGRGSRFELCFPRTLEPGEWHDVEDGDDEEEVPVTGKVLVIEDLEDVLAVMVGGLSAAGHEILTATSGEEGLEVLVQHPDVELVLSDIGLPGIDGFEVARRIVRREVPPAVLLMSAEVRPDALTLARIHPELEFIAKPFSFSELRETVSRLLLGRRVMG